MTDGPLHGVRVLEFSLIIAGPFLGMNLADLGADVIKVEPPEGELRRHNGVVPGTSKQFQWVNRGKRSLQLDLKLQAARDVVYRMIEDVDVVVTNYRPGVPRRLGIDYDTLSKINPRLIYANISAFGPEGPLANDGAADMAAQAYSGAMAANGKLDEFGAPEGIGGIVLADAAGGLGGAMGVCAALFHRERTGEGQLIESALVHSAMAMAGMNTMREETTDRTQRDPIVKKYAEIRAKGGSYADLIASRSPTARGPIRRRGANYWAGYNAKDGALVFSGNTVPGRRAIRRVLGFDEAGDDDPKLDVDAPDFEPRVLSEREEIRRLLRERTVAEWMTLFRAADAPVAPVLLPEEIADDEQGKYYFQDLVHPVTGKERQVKPIVTLSKSPARIRATADMLGEHNEEILAEYNFSPEEIEQVRAAGVFG